MEPVLQKKTLYLPVPLTLGPKAAVVAAATTISSSEDENNNSNNKKEKRKPLNQFSNTTCSFTGRCARDGLASLTTSKKTSKSSKSKS